MLGLAFLSFGVSCAMTKSRLDARKLFFASIIYLPLLLAVMMVDRSIGRWDFDRAVFGFVVC